VRYIYIYIYIENSVCFRNKIYVLKGQMKELCIKTFSAFFPPKTKVMFSDLAATCAVESCFHS